MENLDLFNNVRPLSAIEYESVLVKAEYIRKLESGFFDNDASNPMNKIFVKHGDSKLIKGVDRSFIDGSLLVYENCQTFLRCTPDEIPNLYVNLKKN